MDLILNPIFILLLTFGGLCSFAVLTWIKWRHHRAGTTVSTMSGLHHDLTTGRFGPFWSFAIATGRILGMVGMSICLVLILSEHFGDAHPKSSGHGNLDLNDQLAKRLAEIAPGGKSPGGSSFKRFGQNKPAFDDLDKQLADRAREVAAASPGTSEWNGLRGSKDDFVRNFGNPFTAHDKSPVLTGVGFHHDDVSLLVWFWNGSAHEIDIIQKDGKPLPEQAIQWGLSTFGGSDKWVETSRSKNGQSVVWKQEGAFALFDDADNYTFGDELGPINSLKIVTDEYMKELDTSKGSSAVHQ